MGSITNQFLKGNAWRNRSHHHVPVKVQWEQGNEWGEVAGEITATSLHASSLGDYQIISFTRPELNRLVAKMAKQANPRTRKSIAANILLSLSDDAFGKLMAQVFEKREQMRHALTPEEADATPAPAPATPSRPLVTSVTKLTNLSATNSLSDLSRYLACATTHSPQP